VLILFDDIVDDYSSIIDSMLFYVYGRPTVVLLTTDDDELVFIVGRS
jgi:hypothetical protein